MRQWQADGTENVIAQAELLPVVVSRHLWSSKKFRMEMEEMMTLGCHAVKDTVSAFVYERDNSAHSSMIVECEAERKPLHADLRL